MTTTICLFVTCVALAVNSAFAGERSMQRYAIKSGTYVVDALAVSAKEVEIKHVIIFIGGSGEWEIVDTYLQDPASSYGNMPRYYLEDELLDLGFAFLYINKRGIGKSTGNWKKTGFRERADDAVAATAFVQEEYNIPVSSIGLVGHSQGCWIAQIAAVRIPQLSFVINLAGPFMDPYKQTLINDEESYKCQNLLPRTVKKKKYWRHKELALGRAVGPIIGGEAGHWARIARYDSTANSNTLHAIRVPTLFVFSEHDVMVPPAENTDYAKKIFPKGLPSHIEVYHQTGIDHFMHAAESPCDPYPWTLDPTPPYSAELKKKIQTWIASITDRK